MFSKFLEVVTGFPGKKKMESFSLFFIVVHRKSNYSDSNEKKMVADGWAMSSHTPAAAVMQLSCFDSRNKTV